MRAGRARAALAAVVVVGLAGCSGGGDDTNPEAAGERKAGTGGAALSALPADIRDWEIAFMHAPQGSGQADLFVAKADGSGLTRLDDLPGDEQTPNWSPDGRRVAIRWVPRDYDNTPLLVIDTETSEVLDLTKRTGLRGFSPSWSPDGKRLVTAAKRKASEKLSLYVVDADGSRIRQITSGEREAQYAAWSPDGNEIAFTYVVDGGFDLFTIRPDGTGVRRLTTDGARGQNNWAMWSPDGQRIAWGKGDEIWVMNRDGSDKRIVTREGGVPAAWAPAPYIAFGCEAQSGISLCAVDPDGDEVIPLLNGIDAGFPGWRPPIR